jgi:hypothetical protein
LGYAIAYLILFPHTLRDLLKRIREHQERVPWGPKVQMHRDGSGASVRLCSLRPAVEMVGVSCRVPLPDHQSPARQPRGAGGLGPDEPVEYVYPDDFEDAVWPLPRGEYQVMWAIQMPNGDNVSMNGGPIKVRR